MVSNLNLNNINVGDDGRVSFGGTVSGIDTRSAIDNIIAAKRIPVDRIEAEIDTNLQRSNALNNFNPLITSLRNASDSLRGALSVDNSADQFENKEAFASSRSLTGGTASAPGSLLGVTIANNAQVGVNEFEVLQLATADVVSSAQFDSTDTFDQGAGGLGLADTIRINYLDDDGNAQFTDINILATDTLNDIRGRINAANTGTNKTGVQAQIIEVVSDDPLTVGDESMYALQITSENTGASNALDIRALGAGLTGLGIKTAADATLTGGAAAGFSFQTRFAQDAELSLPGVPGAAIETADFFDTDADTNFEIGDGTITLNDTLGTSVAYPLVGGAGTDLNDWATALNGQVFGTTTLVATVVAGDAAGAQRLRVEAADGRQLSFGGAAGLVGTTGGDDGVATFGNEALTVSRASNTIDDVFQGITIDLFQAEPGTVVELEIDRNLNGIKESIVNFVNAYNDLRTAVNQQREVDPLTGQPVEDAALFGTGVLSAIESELNVLIGNGAQGLDSGFSVLAQIGIDFIDNESLTDSTLESTLTVDDTELDNALLNDFDSVRNLFSYSYSIDDPRLQLTSFNRDVGVLPTGFQITGFDFDGTNITAAATTDGATVTFTGRTLTIETGALAGSTFFFNGPATGGPIDIGVDNGLGVAHDFFFGLDRFDDDEFGLITNEVSALEDSNDAKQNRVDQLLDGLAREQERLEERFARMEADLARLDGIRQQVESVFGAFDQE